MTKTSGEVMLFEQAGKAFESKEVELPSVQAGEYLIRIVYTTICTSDLHTFNGRRPAPGSCVLGHEIIGKIVEMGEGARLDHTGEELQTGDLVTWSVYAFDADSEMSKRGIPQKSANLFKYGHQKFTVEDPVSGGFSTHCLLKKGTAVFKLPSEISYEEAAPLNCTHATIAGAMRLAGDVKNKIVMVTGAGMLGLSACAMAKEAGAKHVIAMDVNEDRLTEAGRFGADLTVNGELTIEETLEQLVSTGKVDVVIDTTGVPAAMEKTLQLLNIGGVTIWVGAVYNNRTTNIDAETVVRNLLTIKGLHNYTPQDLGTAIDFVQRTHKIYPFRELVHRSFPLKELNEAFEMANTNKFYRIGVSQ